MSLGTNMSKLAAAARQSFRVKKDKRESADSLSSNNDFELPASAASPSVVLECLDVVGNFSSKPHLAP